MTVTAEFSWLPVDDAIKYYYEVINTYTTAVELSGEVTAPTTSVVAHDVYVNTPYLFKVKTICSLDGENTSEFSNLISVSEEDFSNQVLRLNVVGLGPYQGGITYTFSNNELGEVENSAFMNTDFPTEPGGITKYMNYTPTNLAYPYTGPIFIQDNTLYLKVSDSYWNPIPRITIYVNWKGDESLTPRVTNKITITDAPINEYFPIDFSLFGINLVEAIIDEHIINIAIVQETIEEQTPTEISEFLEEEFDIIYP